VRRLSQHYGKYLEKPTVKEATLISDTTRKVKLLPKEMVQVSWNIFGVEDGNGFLLTTTRAHIPCSDGAISEIEKQGRAVCSAAVPKDGAGFMLHV